MGCVLFQYSCRGGFNTHSEPQVTWIYTLVFCLTCLLFLGLIIFLSPVQGVTHPKIFNNHCSFGTGFIILYWCITFPSILRQCSYTSAKDHKDILWSGLGPNNESFFCQGLWICRTKCNSHLFFRTSTQTAFCCPSMLLCHELKILKILG